MSNVKNIKLDIEIDDRKVLKALKRAKMSETDMLEIEAPMGLTVVNKQREKVPVLTAATQNSVTPEIQEASDEKVVDHIGPQTDYAPSIEFGIKKRPNYPIQPFVRPSIFGNERNIINVATTAYKKVLRRLWQISKLT